MTRYRGSRRKGGIGAVFITGAVFGTLIFLAGAVLIGLGAAGVGRPTSLDSMTAMESQVGIYNTRIANYSNHVSRWSQLPYDSSGVLLRVTHNQTAELLFEGELQQVTNESTSWRTKGMNPWSPLSFLATFALPVNSTTMPFNVSFFYNGTFLGNVPSSDVYVGRGMLSQQQCREGFGGSYADGSCTVSLRLRELCASSPAESGTGIGFPLQPCWDSGSSTPAISRIGTMRRDCRACVLSSDCTGDYQDTRTCNRFNDSTYFCQVESVGSARSSSVRGFSAGYEQATNEQPVVTVRFRVRISLDPFVWAYYTTLGTMSGLAHDDDNNNNNTGPFLLFVWIGLGLFFGGLALFCISCVGGCLTISYKRHKKVSGNAHLSPMAALIGCCGILHSHWTSSPTVIQVPSNSGIGTTGTSYEMRPPVSSPSADFAKGGAPDSSSSGSEA